MIINLRDWCLDVDIAATVKFSEILKTDHCECGYCRNYYQVVRNSYPELSVFLSELGVDLEAPVDFLPVEPTLCVVSYAIAGRIITPGKLPIYVGDMPLTVQQKELLDYTLDFSEPYFVITTDYLELPWILDEDMDQVVSPANEPECMERMYRKLLQKAEFDSLLM